MSTLREDGFVSLDATGTEGVVETKLLKLPEDRSTLEVNVCPFNTRPGYDPMRVSIDILGAGGELISSHTVAPPAGEDRIWCPIDLDGSLPENIRLRFRLYNARLYSFRFAAGPELR